MECENTPVDPLSVMLGEMKALQVQVLETVRDMSERLRRVEGLQSGHEARIASIEYFVKSHQDLDNRDRPTIMSAAPIVVSMLALGVTILFGVVSFILK